VRPYKNKKVFTYTKPTTNAIYFSEDGDPRNNKTPHILNNL
jgi:hypothetical protein